MGLRSFLEKAAPVGGTLIGGIYGGPAGAAAGGALGSALGGDGQENIGPGDYYPDWLKQDWQNLGGQIAGMPVPQYYPGQTVANQNPMQLAGQQGMYDYGNTGGLGDQMRNTMQKYGKQGVQAMDKGLNYANRMQLFGPNQFNYDQGTYDQVMGNLTPGMGGQYDAMMRDPIRQYQEQTIPGINSAAAGSGNSFATIPFNKGAIAARGLADRGADTAANIWTNASNQANQAAYGAGGMNLDSANAQQGNLLDTYGNYASLGGNMLNSAYNMGTGNVNMQNKAGLMQNQFDQNWINSEVDRWNYEQNAPMNHLGQQLDMVNAQRSNAAPRTVGPTLMEQLYNGGQMGAGLWDTFGAMFSGAPPAPSYAPQTGWANQEQDQLSGRYNPGSYTPMPNY